MTVEALIRRARRRFVLNEALGQLAFAASVTLGGLALLLTAGTRWLDWWTLIPVCAAGLAMGAWRLRRATPTAYATAVRVDRNAELRDALSTAWHFACEKSRFGEAQRRQAEAAAAQVDLDRAVPFTMPRSIYLVAGRRCLPPG